MLSLRLQLDAGRSRLNVQCWDAQRLFCDSCAAVTLPPKYSPSMMRFTKGDAVSVIVTQLTMIRVSTIRSNHTLETIWMHCFRGKASLSRQIHACVRAGRGERRSVGFTRSPCEWRGSAGEAVRSVRGYRTGRAGRCASGGGMGAARPRCVARGHGAPFAQTGAPAPASPFSAHAQPCSRSHQLLVRLQRPSPLARPIRRAAPAATAAWRAHISMGENMEAVGRA